MVRRVHEAEMKLNVWTVDDIQHARRLADAAVDGIITNAPRYLIEKLTENDSP
jgi:glycerophosphoryl diester phosphodiesterase